MFLPKLWFFQICLIDSWLRLIWLINTLHSANTVAKSTGMILKCSFFIAKKSLCMLCRVLKRLCHVAMALKNSVLNSHFNQNGDAIYHIAAFFLFRRNRLKKEKTTLILIMWKHLVTSKEFCKEKCKQVRKRLIK